MVTKMISIIVPVYQGEATLAACLNSILAQTYLDFEIIVVNDGSKDRTGAIAEEYSRQYTNIRVIQQENQGASVARNAGIAVANGEYIQFLDSDDLLLEEACQTFMTAMTEQKADLVIAGYWHNYYRKRVLKTPPFTGTFQIQTAEPEVLSLYREGALNMPWNKLYKRELIKQGFPETMKLGEDLFFNLDYLLMCSNFTLIGEPVCSYRQDERKTNLSTTGQTTDNIHILNLYDKMEAFCHTLYGNGCFEKMIAGRTVEELLNQISESAFCRKPFGKVRMEWIRSQIAWFRTFEQSRKQKGYAKLAGMEELNYTDHRILFVALANGFPKTLAFLTFVRSLLVRVARVFR